MNTLRHQIEGRVHAGDAYIAAAVGVFSASRKVRTVWCFRRVATLQCGGRFYGGVRSENHRIHGVFKIFGSSLNHFLYWV